MKCFFNNLKIIYIKYSKTLLLRNQILWETIPVPVKAWPSMKSAHFIFSFLWHLADLSGRNNNLEKWVLILFFQKCESRWNAICEKRVPSWLLSKISSPKAGKSSCLVYSHFAFKVIKWLFFFSSNAQFNYIIFYNYFYSPNFPFPHLLQIDWYFLEEWLFLQFLYISYRA